MKKLCLSVLFMAIGVMAFAGQKVDLKFSDKIASGKGVVKENVLSIIGDSAAKNNAWRSVVFSLPFQTPAGKEFVFSGDIKAEKIKGEFWIAIRLIKADGKTLKYEVYKITKDQDWKVFIKTFTAPPETASMAFYIVGRKMGNESIGSVKNLSIEQLN